MEKKQEVSQTDLIEAAQKLVADNPGMMLSDAMAEAESQLMPAPELQSEFTLQIAVKPRVARFIADVFGGHAKYSVEHRLNAWAQMIINNQLQIEKASARPVPDIVEGRAVTMTRDQYAEKAPKT